MFLRDFPLSIPEFFKKKELMLFFTNKNPLKNQESHSLHGKTTPPKTNGWIPKIMGWTRWFLWNMAFFWYVKSLGVEFLSNLGHWSRCIWSKKLDPQKKNTRPRMVLKKPLKMDSVTEKSILFLVKKGSNDEFSGQSVRKKNKKNLRDLRYTNYNIFPFKNHHQTQTPNAQTFHLRSRTHPRGTGIVPRASAACTDVCRKLCLRWGFGVENQTYVVYMGVSNNGGTPKWMVYNGKPY